MTITLPTRLLLATLLAASATCAQAARYIEVSGNNMQFFYDADVWGDNSATVVGNSISFAPLGRFGGSVTSGPGEYRDLDGAIAGKQSVVAVAHQGMALTGDIDYSLGVTYSVAPNGYVLFGGNFDAFYGSFANGKFQPSHSRAETAYFQMAETASGGTVHRPLLGESNNELAGMTSDAVGVNTSTHYFMDQYDTGTTSLDFHKMAFDFGVISAVPEPQTYGMMLAGLAVIGVVARRRKAT